MNRCWSNAGSASQTLDQHYSSIGQYIVITGTSRELIFGTTLQANVCSIWPMYEAAFHQDILTWLKFLLGQISPFSSLRRVKLVFVDRGAALVLFVIIGQDLFINARRQQTRYRQACSHNVKVLYTTHVTLFTHNHL